MSRCCRNCTLENFFFKERKEREYNNNIVLYCNEEWSITFYLLYFLTIKVRSDIPPFTFSIELVIYFPFKYVKKKSLPCEQILKNLQQLLVTQKIHTIKHFFKIIIYAQFLNIFSSNKCLSFAAARKEESKCVFSRSWCLSGCSGLFIQPCNKMSKHGVDNAAVIQELKSTRIHYTTYTEKTYFNYNLIQGYAST